MKEKLFMWIVFCIVYSVVMIWKFDIKFGFNFATLIGVIFSAILFSQAVQSNKE